MCKKKSPKVYEKCTKSKKKKEKKLFFTTNNDFFKVIKNTDKNEQKSTKGCKSMQKQ